MKKKELEIILQGVPDFIHPQIKLEQYLTPAVIAADIIFEAYKFGDVEGKNVVDLGCGTGIFSVGAYVLNAKSVVGFDCEKECIEIAKKHAKKFNFSITYFSKDVENVSTKCDTVIMNPPFGAQKSNYQADRKFIKKAIEIAPVIYSLHLSKTIPFITKLISALGCEISHFKNYIFPIKGIHTFHKKQLINFDVSMIRVISKD
ncbi:MAG: methyltransferase [Candidatus Thermoplasmatota archaeon]|nr:methyltransferase [Candidatus Thermoplasmatota archaeon]